MKNLRILITLLLLTGLGKPASADILGLSFGALAGISTLSTNNEFGMGTGALGFGARVGIEFLSTLSVNAEWTYMSTTPANTTTGYTSNFSTADLSADLIINIIPTKLRLFFGPKVGQGWTAAGGYSGSSTTIGGEVGADFFMGSTWSLGAETTYLSVGAPTLNGTTGNTGSLFQMLAAIKYWL